MDPNLHVSYSSAVSCGSCICSHQVFWGCDGIVRLCGFVWQCDPMLHDDLVWIVRVYHNRMPAISYSQIVLLLMEMYGIASSPYAMAIQRKRVLMEMYGIAPSPYAVAIQRTRLLDLVQVCLSWLPPFLHASTICSIV